MVALSLSPTPTQPITVVAAKTDADLDVVMEIDRLSFPTPWLRQAFSEEMARPWARLEILREQGGGRAIGFCNYWLVADELHILNIAVHPDFRKQGHASTLLRHILAVGREAKARVISLEVRLSNQPAQMLYKKFGFHEVGRRPRYYADNGEDAVLMDLPMAG
jgi:ribosomal-protein-alanine N-acetyltransferase